MIIDQEIMNNIAIKDELDEYCNKYKGRVYYDQKENRFVQIRETITNSPVRDGFVCSDYPNSQEPTRLEIKNKLTSKSKAWYKSNLEDVNKFLRRNLYLDEIKVTRR